MAISFLDRHIRVYDLTEGNLVCTLSGHSEVVTAIKFTRDFTRLISVAGDGCIFIWSLAPEMTIAMKKSYSEKTEKTLRERAKVPWSRVRQRGSMFSSLVKNRPVVLLKHSANRKFVFDPSRLSPALVQLYNSKYDLNNTDKQVLSKGTPSFFKADWIQDPNESVRMYNVLGIQILPKTIEEKRKSMQKQHYELLSLSSSQDTLGKPDTSVLEEDLISAVNLSEELPGDGELPESLTAAFEGLSAQPKSIQPPVSQAPAPLIKTLQHSLPPHLRQLQGNNTVASHRLSLSQRFLAQKNTPPKLTQLNNLTSSLPSTPNQPPTSLSLSSSSAMLSSSSTSQGVMSSNTPILQKSLSTSSIANTSTATSSTPKIVENSTVATVAPTILPRKLQWDQDVERSKLRLLQLGIYCTPKKEGDNTSDIIGTPLPQELDSEPTESDDDDHYDDACDNEEDINQSTQHSSSPDAAYPYDNQQIEMFLSQLETVFEQSLLLYETINKSAPLSSSSSSGVPEISHRFHSLFDRMRKKITNTIGADEDNQKIPLAMVQQYSDILVQLVKSKLESNTNSH